MALGGILLQATTAEAFQQHRHTRVQFPQRHRLLLQHLQEV